MDGDGVIPYHFSHVNYMTRRETGLHGFKTFNTFPDHGTTQVDINILYAN